MQLFLDDCVPHFLVYQHLPKKKIKDSTPSQFYNFVIWTIYLKKLLIFLEGKNDIFTFKIILCKFPSL
jgi:hypothetical protein